MDVDTIFGDLRRECLHQRVVRNTIFRKAPPSVVFGYGKRSINLNKVVATFEKHIFLSQTDLTRTEIISNSYNQKMCLLHCDEWDRVVALPRHKFVTGATLLQLVPGYQTTTTVKHCKMFINYYSTFNTTVKPVYSGHLGEFDKMTTIDR